MHASVSGLADQLAEDEHDCIRLGREAVASLGWRKLGPGPTRPADEPLCDPEELLGLAPVDLKVPADVREILARVVDGSRFAEWKPLYGANLVCGWASVHGYPVGVLANAQGVLFSEESNKAAHFIQLANQAGTPLLFLQNTTGYMVGKAYEQRGIIKDGAKMINAVANSTVPHVTLILGASYGAGGYGMAGRAYDPRFLFTWPASRSAVMGPEQLAGVMSILNRASAEGAGRPGDEEADRSVREAVRDQVDAESRALFNTGLLYDDGIIDPRDTRTVLGIALSACHSGEVKGTDGFGVFRM
jgi:acetyl-CoA carboxylase carboxyltransferase component